MALYTKENDELKRVAIGKVQHDTSLVGDGTTDSELSVNTTDVKAGYGIKITENVDDNEVSIDLDTSNFADGKQYAMTKNGWADFESGKGYSKVKVGSTVMEAPAAESQFEIAAGTGISLTASDTDKKITIESSVTVDPAYEQVAVVTPPEEEGDDPVVTNLDASSTNKTLKVVAGTNIILTPDKTDNSVTITAVAESATDITVSAGTGIAVDVDTSTTPGTTDYKVSLGYELGFIGGTARDVTITETNQNLLEDITITDTMISADDRFIIRDNTLYALAVTEDVQGVDMFTISFNGTLTRSPVDGYYYLNEVKIQKVNSASSIVEGSDYYASQTGTSFISMSTTIKNNSTISAEFDGKKYYGYSIIYTGDAPNDGETGMTMTYRMSAVEETIGIANSNGGGVASDGTVAYSSADEPGYWDDKVNLKYPLKDGLSHTNTIDVEISTGEGTKEGMVMALVKEDGSNELSIDWVTPSGGGIVGCDGEVRINEDDPTLGYLDTKLVAGLGIKIQETDTSSGKSLAIIADSDYESTITPATPFPKLVSDVSMKFYRDETFNKDTASEYTVHYGIGRQVAGQAQPMQNVVIMPISFPSGKIESISVMSTKGAETYNGNWYITVGLYGADVDDCAAATAWGQVSMCRHDKTSNLFKLVGIQDQSPLAGNVYYKKYATDVWSDRVSSNKGLSLNAKGLFNWAVIGFSYDSINSIDFSIAGLEMSNVLQQSAAFAQHRGIGLIGSPTNHSYYHDGRPISETVVATENLNSIALPFVQFNIVREDTTTGD